MTQACLSSSARRRQARSLAVGLAFLAPGIAGFLAFTLLPLVLSLGLAFSDWDLRLHNRFKSHPLHFVGLDNFIELLRDANFWRYLGNTLFLMLGIPLSIAGSLLAAILLSQDLRKGVRRIWLWLVLLASVVGAGALGLAWGWSAAPVVMVLLLTAVGVLALGLAGGNPAYRTLFYMPCFTSGVATYLLWKKMFNPLDGPINQALTPVLGVTESVVNALPGAAVRLGGSTVLMSIILLLWHGALRQRIRSWRDGETGSAALALGVAVLSVPVWVGLAWRPGLWPGGVLAIGWGVVMVMALGRMKAGRLMACRAWSGVDGMALILSLVVAGQLACVGLAHVCLHLPEMAAQGLTPPLWIHDYHWAKPSLILMGLWASIGSNNMLLYMAALSNVPSDLYEAAQIDGASASQRFWHVTWPQLAPTTFFIVVMSIIGGLQGGFESARTMTQGGPAGATTTLSYFIYNEGFQTGRLGLASAISWVMFAMIFLVTLMNWRLGNRYVNE